MNIPEQKLDAILTRHAIASDRLNAGPDAESFVALSRELSELQPIVDAITALKAIDREITDLEALASDSSNEFVVAFHKQVTQQQPLDGRTNSKPF